MHSNNYTWITNNKVFVIAAINSYNTAPVGRIKKNRIKKTSGVTFVFFIDFWQSFFKKKKSTIEQEEK